MGSLFKKYIIIGTILRKKQPIRLFCFHKPFLSSFYNQQFSRNKVREKPSILYSILQILYCFPCIKKYWRVYIYQASIWIIHCEVIIHTQSKIICSKIVDAFFNHSQMEQFPPSHLHFFKNNRTIKGPLLRGKINISLIKGKWFMMIVILGVANFARASKQWIFLVSRIWCFILITI